MSVWTIWEIHWSVLCFRSARSDGVGDTGLKESVTVVDRCWRKFGDGLELRVWEWCKICRSWQEILV